MNNDNKYYAGAPRLEQLNWGQWIKVVNIYTPKGEVICEVDGDFVDAILANLNKEA